MKRSVTANAGKDYTCHVGDAGSSPACLATGSSVTGSTPALRSDVFSIRRRRDASLEISRPWRMPVGLHPATEVRRVKRLGNREMRVRTPPWERSLRTVSRHSCRHGLRQKSGRMPERLHRLVSARSRVRVPPGPSCGPVAQLVEQDVFPNPRRRNSNISAGMPARTTFALVRKGLGYFLVPPPKKAGECRWEYIGEVSACGSSPQVLINPRRRHRLDGRMPVGLHGRAPAQAGGRRFDSVSGQPDSSVEMSDHTSSPTASSAANAVGTTLSPVRVRPGLRACSSVDRA